MSEYKFSMFKIMKISYNHKVSLIMKKIPILWVLCESEYILNSITNTTLIRDLKPNGGGKYERS